MIKRRTLQVSSSKYSIKKDMLFSLGQTEIILVGQGGVLPPSPLPPPLATRLMLRLTLTSQSRSIEKSTNKDTMHFNCWK